MMKLSIHIAGPQHRWLETTWAFTLLATNPPPTRGGIYFTSRPAVAGSRQTPRRPACWPEAGPPMSDSGMRTAWHMPPALSGIIAGATGPKGGRGR